MKVTEKKLVYCAGPMRGRPEFNFPKFDDARDDLMIDGYIPISPADHDRESGFDPSGMTGNEDLTGTGFDLRKALAWDLQQVSQAWGIMLLPGWEKSQGARAELATAAALGLQAAEYGDFDGKNWRPAVDFMPHMARQIADPFVRNSEVPTQTVTTWGGDEIRVTDPNTGGQKGTKEVRLDLVPIHPLTELGRLYGRGAKKYEDNNWRKGYKWSLSYAALLRHVTQWWGGENTDPEMGTSHLASVAWHAFALAEFERTHPELDDRP